MWTIREIAAIQERAGQIVLEYAWAGVSNLHFLYFQSIRNPERCSDIMGRICDEHNVDVDAADKIPCGGLKGTPCPKGWFCVDDPDDKCDPTKGGADCIGVCVSGLL